MTDQFAPGGVFADKSPEELVELYHQSKEAYYSPKTKKAQPLISDIDYDALEEYLDSGGYIEKYVGVDNVPGTKIPHMNKMLSLDKVQVFVQDIETGHLDLIRKALARQSADVLNQGAVVLEWSWKLDGLAVNISYYQGNLTTAATRGNGEVGTDITARVRHLLPKKLANGFTGEIRGEIFVDKVVFVEKYSTLYKNPRNLAAGIMSSHDMNDPRLVDIKIMLFEVKDTKYSLDDFPELKKLKHPAKLGFNTDQNMTELYNFFLERRSMYSYPTDGIVVRISVVNEQLDNGHTPLYAVSVKFPPQTAVATIKEIQWNIRKIGNYIPKAILFPTELDGSVVTHVSLHNYAYVNTKGLYPGAQIIIGKNGDIVPQVQSVVSPVFEPSGLPEDTAVSENGIHLVSTISVEEITAQYKFTTGMSTLGFFGYAGKTFAKMYKLMDGKVENIFCDELFTDRIILDIFGKGSSGDAFLPQRKDILTNKFTMNKLLLAMQFNNCGENHCSALSDFYFGGGFDPKGLNRKVVNELTTPGRESHDRVVQAIQLATDNGYEIHRVKRREISDADITFEMTGSPKSAGFKEKKDFTKYVFNWIPTKLSKTTTYLITDDLESKTTKMKFAHANGIKVLTYEQAAQIFKESL